MTPLLQIDQLTKGHGKTRILSDLSLKLLPRQNLVLTGPSGCGKSTLLRLIAGLDAPDEGVIHLEGRIVSDGRTMLVPPHHRGLSMVFQDLGLWPNLTAFDNVMLGLSGVKLPRKEKQQRALSALADCGIELVAKSCPARLSGGEQQRVALARAMALRPRLLLLDEPFSGLDIVLRRSLLEILRGLSAQGVSILLVSHHLPDACLLDASIAVLENGVIAESGIFDALLENPRSATLKAWKDGCA